MEAACLPRSEEVALCRDEKRQGTGEIMHVLCQVPTNKQTNKPDLSFAFRSMSLTRDAGSETPKLRFSRSGSDQIGAYVGSRCTTP